jgi:hypothetical protein
VTIVCYFGQRKIYGIFHISCVLRTEIDTEITTYNV